MVGTWNAMQGRIELTVPSGKRAALVILFSAGDKKKWVELKKSDGTSINSWDNCSPHPLSLVTMLDEGSYHIFPRYINDDCSGSGTAQIPSVTSTNGDNTVTDREFECTGGEVFNVTIVMVEEQVG